MAFSAALTPSCLLHVQVMMVSTAQYDALMVWHSESSPAIVISMYAGAMLGVDQYKILFEGD